MDAVVLLRPSVAAADSSSAVAQAASATPVPVLARSADTVDLRERIGRRSAAPAFAAARWWCVAHACGTKRERASER